MLLWRNAWRFHAQHIWQTSLSVLGIALGVMMVVAVDLASNSARRAFDLSVESVSGSITHQIVGGSQGVPETIFTALRTELGIRRSAPVVSQEVRLQNENLTLLGLDLISEASLQRRLPGLERDPLELASIAAGAIQTENGVLLAGSLAEKLQLAPGESFNLAPPDGTILLTLVETLDDREREVGSILFADISTAQRILERSGRLDSIDLVLTESQVIMLRSWLPQELTLVETATRNHSLQQMTGAFHINLLAMSMLALLVAALLIYNTVSLSVLERRASFGVLRSLGVSRGEVAKLIMAENALFGLVASMLGVVAGIWLGSMLVEMVTRTIDDLYFNLTVKQYQLDFLLLLKGFSWGVGATLLAAALPAWQAGQSPPITLQQKGQDGLLLQQGLPWLSLAGLVLLLGGVGALFIGNSLIQGFVALFLLIFGFCLLVPHAMHLLLRSALKLRLVRHRFTLRLALRNIESSLDRTALAVAALTVAVSVTVGVGIMVNSLRSSVLLWLDQSLAGDVQVTRIDNGGGLDADQRRLILESPGINHFSAGYQLQAESNLGPLRVQAVDSEESEWLFLKSGRLENENSVLVSEPMATLLGLEVGDALILQTALGPQQLQVSGVFYDYTTGNPLISLSSAQLLRYWPGTEPRRLTLYLQSSTDLEVMTTGLRDALQSPDETILVSANSAIYQATLIIFDRTFAITHVLRLLAVIVAFVGVFSAMLALQLQRLRDYAILRASGMTITEVARLILLQTFVMGLFAGILALPLGIMMSEVLIDVINMRSFGWSMQHSLPRSVLVEALLLAITAAVLAGLIPARKLADVHPAQALRRE